MDQMNHFAGNMLQLENNRQGKDPGDVQCCLAFSSAEQKEKLSGYNRITACLP